MKSSEALRRARPLIESGENGLVCLALYRVAPGQQRAKNHIQKLLFPNGTLEGWLRDQRGIETSHECDFDRLRITRLAWIDDMIAWHEARGD